MPGEAASKAVIKETKNESILDQPLDGPVEGGTGEGERNLLGEDIRVIDKEDLMQAPAHEE